MTSAITGGTTTVLFANCDYMYSEAQWLGHLPSKMRICSGSIATRLLIAYQRVVYRATWRDNDQPCRPAGIIV